MGVTGAESRDQHVLLRGERFERWLGGQPRMALPHHADIALDPQRLAPDAFGQVRERAHGEIDRAGLEPRIEMLRVELHGAEPHMRRLLLQQIDQRRQKLDHAGIDHAEGERAARCPGIERHVLGAQRTHAVEHGANRRLETQRLGRRLHAKRYAHEQRIVEIAAQPRQGLAERRLGDAKHPRRPRQASLTQQDLKHLQMMQIELACIT